MSNAFPCSPSRRENSPPKLIPFAREGEGVSEGRHYKRKPGLQPGFIALRNNPLPHHSQVKR